ncbi:AAA family ATPase [Candidatus Bipolaricaulota bacterium]|nr:AAA family ATPase [Candidatus Bipolaricaulota bacterium]
MSETAQQKVLTGIEGLDEILDGGLVPHRTYLIRGEAGTGKTILGLNYLIQGVEEDEESLFITFSETEEQIVENGRSMGLDPEGVRFLDLSPGSEKFTEEESYDVFHPSEVDKEPITEKIKETVEELDPDRIFMDAITILRHLHSDQYQFRQQILSLSQFFADQGATVLFTSESSPRNPDADLQFMSDGIMELKRKDGRRELEVVKFRGSGFQGGDHALEITGEGLKVYPRLVPKGPKVGGATQETLSSGIPEVDEMLHGGLEGGTVTLFTGPSGTGKTSLALQFAKEAAGRGVRTAVYNFDEDKDLLNRRSEAINIPIGKMIEGGNLLLEAVEPMELTIQQFAQRVRKEVEEKGAKIVVLDSVNGYNLSIKGEKLQESLYNLSQYFRKKGITAILTNEVSKITGEFQASDMDITVVADNVVFFRYLELRGELRKAIGVLKKRVSDFERNLREFEITEHGIKVGAPMDDLRGILSGQPEWEEKSPSGAEE